MPVHGTFVSLLLSHRAGDKETAITTETTLKNGQSFSHIRLWTGPLHMLFITSTY